MKTFKSIMNEIVDENQDEFEEKAPEITDDASLLKYLKYANRKRHKNVDISEISDFSQDLV